MEKCSDSAQKFYPQRTVCWATVEVYLAEKRYAELHGEGSGARFHDGSERSWNETQDREHPVPAGTGQSIWVSDVDHEPDATWLSGESRDGDEQRADGQEGD